VPMSSYERPNFPIQLRSLPFMNARSLFGWQTLWNCQKLRTCNKCMEPNGKFHYFEWQVTKYCGIY